MPNDPLLSFHYICQKYYGLKENLTWDKETKEVEEAEVSNLTAPCQG